MTLFRLNTMRLASVLLCSAALALPALAQTDTPPPPDHAQGPGGPGGPGGRRGGGPEQRVAMMTKQLDLTPDQSAKVKTILEEGRTQMQALRGDNAAATDNREKMMDLMKAENEKIKAVLTADQKTKYEEMMKRQRERRQGGGGPGGAGGGDASTPPPPPPPPQN